MNKNLNPFLANPEKKKLCFISNQNIDFHCDNSSLFCYEEIVPL